MRKRVEFSEPNAWGSSLRRALGALSALLAVLTGTPSAAAATLAWSSTGPCPDREEVVARVERGLGTKLEDTLPLAFSATAAQVGDHWVLTLSVSEGDVERPARRAAAAHDAESKVRRLEAADCDKLVDALAVAMALALGLPEPATTSDEPVKDTPASAASEPRSEPPAETPRRPAPPAPETPEEGGAPLAFDVGPWLLVDSGSLPGVGLGAALEAEGRIGAVGLRLFGEIFPDRFGEVDSSAGAAAGAGADIGLVAGGVLGCFAPGAAERGRSWYPSLCAGLEVGRLSGRGQGVRESRLSSAWWLAPRVDLRAYFTLGGGLTAGLMAGAVVPLIRDEFVLRDIGVVHQAPAVVGRAGLGLELGFR